MLGKTLARAMVVANRSSGSASALVKKRKLCEDWQNDDRRLVISRHKLDGVVDMLYKASRKGDFKKSVKTVLQDTLVRECAFEDDCDMAFSWGYLHTRCFVRMPLTHKYVATDKTRTDRAWWIRFQQQLFGLEWHVEETLNEQQIAILEQQGVQKLKQGESKGILLLMSRLWNPFQKIRSCALVVAINGESIRPAGQESSIECCIRMAREHCERQSRTNDAESNNNNRTGTRSFGVAAVTYLKEPPLVRCYDPSGRPKRKAQSIGQTFSQRKETDTESDTEAGESKAQCDSRSHDKTLRRFTFVNDPQDADILGATSPTGELTAPTESEYLAVANQVHHLYIGPLDAKVIASG